MSDIVKMNIVITGHVDHGKSTVVGRLLADTHTLPEGKLEQVKQNCERNSKPFEYAFLIDALKDEQSQGITIDAARVFFKTKKRNYIIIDAPGHVEFLKNMITGAARAEAALLVIDAHEGVQENSRRHGYMLAMLGITKIAVLINKMDLVSYSQAVYADIVKQYSGFLNEIEIKPACFIPISGMMGDNLTTPSKNMPWYNGHTAIEAFDNFEKEKSKIDMPFRMPVQAVYKFTNFNDNRRIIAGTVLTGKLKTGDTVIFYPSGKKSQVQSIENFNAQPRQEIEAGQAVGFTLKEQIFITRGELAVKDGEPHPQVTSRIRASLFWLGNKPFSLQKEYVLKIGTAKIPMLLEKVIRVIDASTLGAQNHNALVNRHEVAECILKLSRSIVFDSSDKITETGRFVVVDDYEISGGGIIREALTDDQENIREKVLLRNYKWEKSLISQEARADKLNQQSALVFITGEKNSGKKGVAKKLESMLFSEGKMVYFLGIGNVLYGVDADIKNQPIPAHDEHIRRLAEVAYLLMDAGIILIVTAVELKQHDIETVKNILSPDKIQIIWVGDRITTDIAYDLHISNIKDDDSAAELVKKSLINKGYIF
jgi:bifunctional enzyme CysN/CysC